MNLYVDTSALVPLLVDEPSTQVCGEVWDGADVVICTRLGYIEATAALATAVRINRISGTDAVAARDALDELWRSVAVIDLDRDLMAAAADLALRRDLRGYDATHCAAALAVSDSGLVAASGDRRLLAAWQAEGVAVCDVTRS